MITIKYGGHAQPGSGEIEHKFLEEIAFMHRQGERIVLVHGGGPEINRELSERGITPKMVNGYRFTDGKTLEIVQMVLIGKVLQTIVHGLIKAGVDAVGLSAGDAGIIRASKFMPEGVDLGFVGQIDSINTDPLISLLELGLLPVIAPVGVTTHGQALNINADTVAGAIGGALRSHLVLFMTDVPGIYRNWPDPSSLINSISLKELKEIEVSEGMIPKVKAIENALDYGASRVRIYDGREPTNLARALRGEIGTEVVTHV
jgi:acetylglutamate kinase